MQRKAYVSGAAVLLAAVLAGCTGGSGVGSSAPDSKGGDTGTTAAVAQPGKYRTLPEACGAADHDTLDALLPGIQETTDETQQEKAYAGEATLTYDTDRRDGCDWKVASAAATDHLFVDFERVVSYDNTVSDESKAEELYAARQTAADLPEPAASASGDATPSPSGSTVGPADSRRRCLRRPFLPRLPLRLAAPGRSPAARTGRPRRRGVPRRQAEHRLVDGPAAHGDCGVPHVQRDRDDRILRAADGFREHPRQQGNAGQGVETGPGAGLPAQRLAAPRPLGAPRRKPPEREPPWRPTAYRGPSDPSGRTPHVRPYHERHE